MKTLKLILVGLCLAFFAPTQVSAAAGAGIFGFGNKEAAQKFGIYTWTSPIK